MESNETKAGVSPVLSTAGLCLAPLSADDFARQQELETVAQEAAGVTVRLAVITCRCGWKRSVMKMYKCLYCGEWMCEICAEAHFGKTREQYNAERHNGEVQRGARQGGSAGTTG